MIPASIVPASMMAIPFAAVGWGIVVRGRDYNTNG